MTDQEFHAALDAAEIVMDQEFQRHDPPTTHHFIPGFYIRQITMPAGFLCTTKQHGKRHPFVISRGTVIVKDENGDSQCLVAPHVGITEPGTRRILFCETEVVWTTFHMSGYIDAAKIVPLIEEEIMIAREHPVPIADSLNRQTQSEQLSPIIQEGHFA